MNGNINYESMIDFDKGILFDGDDTRINRFLVKAVEKKEVTMAFLGGSITQGSLSSTPETCYAALTAAGLKRYYPETKVNYVNAGIGGTSSHFGAARAVDDVLAYNPDFVVVEFSVNDTDCDFFMETYEGLVRKLLKAECRPAVVLVHNAFYDTAVTAERIHSKIGRHYNLTSLSLNNTVVDAIRRGCFSVSDVSPDALHPNDAGHALISRLILNWLEKKIYGTAYATANSEIPDVPLHAGNAVKAVAGNAAKAVSDETENVMRTAAGNAMGVEKNGDELLPAPLTMNAYEGASRLQNYNCTPVLEGFYADSEPQENIRDIFKCGFIGKEKGNRITIYAEGTELAAQYRKSVKHPACVCKAIVDDTDEIILDGNFDETWGDCLYITKLLVHGERKLHKIEIVVTEGDASCVPFYLVSIIRS